MSELQTVYRCNTPPPLHGVMRDTWRRRGQSTTKTTKSQKRSKEMMQRGGEPVLTKTEYSMEELIELTGFNRAKIIRIVQKNKLKAKQVKEGRVYKHYYLAKDVGKFIIPQEDSNTEVMPKRSKSDLMKIKENENQIESLNDVKETEQCIVWHII